MTLLAHRYLDRLQSLGANQEKKNLDFIKLSNPTNVLLLLLANSNLQSYLSIFAVRREETKAKMSFGDGIART